MAYYNTCPRCGCNLDPGEKCDCEKNARDQDRMNRDYYSRLLTGDKRGGQLTFAFACRKGGEAWA